MKFLNTFSCGNVPHVLCCTAIADVPTLLHQLWHGLQPLLEPEDLLEADHAMGTHHILDTPATQLFQLIECCICVVCHEVHHHGHLHRHFEQQLAEPISQRA